MAKNKKQNENEQGIWLDDLPAIPGVHQQEGFLLAIPADFQVTTDEGVIYNIEVAQVLPRDSATFNLVTTVDEFQATLTRFVNTDKKKLTPSIAVLVTYYDEQLGLYSTLDLWVNLTEVVADYTPSFEPVSGELDTERMVMAFRNFVEYLNTGKYRLE
ncbi:hypothetical protein ACFS7Z_08575 [Pontibacter toksunensis]|uniref:Uncharacterized protein n=1 Tax=Pontibacter toksunensis TaxID=1332631 RepID=A0ABW6BRM9_9BACT